MIHRNFRRWRRNPDTGLKIALNKFFATVLPFILKDFLLRRGGCGAFSGTVKTKVKKMAGR